MIKPDSFIYSFLSDIKKCGGIPLEMFEDMKYDISGWASTQLLDHIAKQQIFVVDYIADVSSFGAGLYEKLDSTMRLPYQNVTLAAYVPDVKTRGLMFPCLVFLQQIDDERIGWHVAYKEDAGWTVQQAEQVLRPGDTHSIFASPIASRHGFDDERLQFCLVRHMVVRFLLALSCTNVTHQSVRNSRIKTSRIKKKNFPIYEHRVLVLKDSRSGKSNATGSHARPRLHLRRGHVRRLPSGNVWVRPCVVGDKEAGVITKDYALR